MTGFTGLGFDPAPGDPRRVAALAESIAAAGRHAADAHDALGSAVSASQPWQGTAAEEFRRRAADLPERLTAHRDGAPPAAEALFDWASALADLRLRAEHLDRQATRLRARLADAEQAVDEWVTAASVASTHTRPAAEATMAEHERARDAVHGDLETVLAQARALAAEHRAGAGRTAARLRSLASPAQPPVGALLAGLSLATRRASRVLRSGTPSPPPAGAVRAALAAEPAVGTSWTFGPAVPVERVVATLAGRDQST
jgi:hypothetical protein